MSSLQDKLNKVKNPTPKGPSVQAWLDKLSAEDRAEVYKALLDTDQYSTHGLFQAFKEEGGRFGREGFTKFRKAYIADHSKGDSDVAK